MLYWFQVYLLVAITIFALAGTVLLSLMLGTILKNYIRAQLPIRQIDAIPLLAEEGWTRH